MSDKESAGPGANPATADDVYRKLDPTGQRSAEEGRARAARAWNDLKGLYGELNAMEIEDSVGSRRDLKRVEEAIAKEARERAPGGPVSQQQRDEAALRVMVQDPRYWRDRDPKVVARVTAGFKRLYPGK